MYMPVEGKEGREGEAAKAFGGGADMIPEEEGWIREPQAAVQLEKICQSGEARWAGMVLLCCRWPGPGACCVGPKGAHLLGR